MKMNLYVKTLVTIIILHFGTSSVKARHIIGGEVIYECLGIDSMKNEVTFKITFTMYRDSRSGGAQFDPSADFGVYRGSGNSWTHFRTINNIRVDDIEEIPIESASPCIITPVNLGVQKGKYSFEIILPIISESYMITYQRCCRNNSILNLVKPEDTGAGFTIEITPTAQSTCNNSPTFTSFPPVVICVNRPINYNHSATDLDGDSLAYEFCYPIAAGGTDGVGGGDLTSCTGVVPSPQNCPPPYNIVTFKSPNFSFDKPMAGDPVVTIDPNTGLIDGEPNFLGQHVVGVCVREYRNGILIGMLRRDFQFNVTTCEVAVAADIKSTAETPTEYTVNSCGETSINFINESTDTRYIKNYYWEFNINGNIKTYNTRNVTVAFPGVGTYRAIMILNKDISNLVDCSDTAEIIVNVYPDIKAEFDFDYDTCITGPIRFTDFSVSGVGAISKWAWDFVEGKSSIQNPNFEFEFPGNKDVKLIVEDANKCRDTIVKKIDYFPIPPVVVIDPNTFVGCKPATIFFKNLTTPIDDTYKLKWDFGDGSDGSNLFSPSHSFTDIGAYDVSLEITSPLGCQSTKKWQRLIKVVQSPEAGFTFTPEVPNIVQNTISFVDQSIDAVSYLWRFTPNNVSNLPNPTFTFQDTGLYKVFQAVLHPSGCSDTAFADIYIAPFIKFFLPTAFTPNNDGLNDEFLPVGLFEGIRDYHLSIWNRWGEQVFVSNDYTIGWDGQSNKVDSDSASGVYAYLIEFVDGLGKKQSLKGHVTVLR